MTDASKIEKEKPGTGNAGLYKKIARDNNIGISEPRKAWVNRTCVLTLKRGAL